MPQIINTNILSMNTQRQLNKTQTMQTTAIERLSSGLRINSAKDDAAGLAISTRFETQVRGLNQAIRNANDGISLSQTAEGSMQEMTNILQRMRELAVQSANDTNSDADRASIQSEVDQLYDELSRIAETTEFNGVKLLDGTAGSRVFHIGADANQTVAFSIDSVTTTALNLNGFSALGDLNGGRIDASLLDSSGSVSIDASNITINGIGLGSFDSATADISIEDVEDLINNNTFQHSVTATAYNVVEGGIASGITSGNLVINGSTVAKSGSMTELVNNINRDVTGITATLNDQGGLILSNDTGNTITITSTSAEDKSAAGLTAGTYAGYLSLSSSDGRAIEVGFDESNGGSAADLQLLGFNVSSGSDTLTGGEINGTFISNADGIQINGIDLGKVQNGTSGTINGSDIAFAINSISDKTGVTASVKTQVEYDVVTTGGDLTVNGVTVTFAANVTLAEMVAQINDAGIQGVLASADAESGRLVLTSQTGLDINVEQASGAVISNTSSYGFAGTADTTYGEITLQGENGKDVIINSTATSETAKAAALAKLGYTDQGGSATAIGLGLDVTTVANANNAILRIDEALDKLSSARASLGAVQNRLASTISNLENVSQSLSAANSRIRDADFAAETSQLTKSQILQQAGIAMLAQANASQQNVLSLLG
jgi:flagellin